jgi:hypothetical protein
MGFRYYNLLRARKMVLEYPSIGNSKSLEEFDFSEASLLTFYFSLFTVIPFR